MVSYLFLFKDMHTTLYLHVLLIQTTKWLIIKIKSVVMMNIH